VDVKDKVVLVRVDFNSPLDPKTKKVLDDARIRAHGSSTIRELAEKGAKVVVLAHQGRKGEPDFIPLKEHAELLAGILSRQVGYVDDVYGSTAREAIKALRSGEILVLGNVRTFPLETSEGKPADLANTELVRSLAPLADLFVLDAFAAAHRAHASIIGFTAVLPSAAGRVMERELRALNRVLGAPQKPSLFILGGAKADDSLEISKYVLGHKIADHVLTGGVVAQVFLVAKGYDLGEQNMAFLEKKGLMALVPGIRRLVQKYPRRILTPYDVAVVVGGKRQEMPVSRLPTAHLIGDIGEKTIEKYGRLIQGAKSIVFSGPMGVYEERETALGTKRILEEIAKSRAFSVAGGGHTISALDEFRLSPRITYVSTAGGALTEFLMGKKLPGVAALEAAAKRKKVRSSAARHRVRSRSKAR
jgi:phosphoglycerate kinase